MWFIPTVLVLAGVIVVHAALRRLVPAGNSVIQFPGIAALGAGALAMGLSFTHVSGVDCLTAFALLAFSCELYLFLFTFAISSVSLALLLETVGYAPPPRESAGETSTPAGRVQRMLESGLLVRAPGGYALSTRGRVVLGVRNALRAFFRHEP